MNYGNPHNPLSGNVRGRTIETPFKATFAQFRGLEMLARKLNLPTANRSRLIRLALDEGLARYLGEEYTQMRSAEGVLLDRGISAPAELGIPSLAVQSDTKSTSKSFDAELEDILRDEKAAKAAGLKSFEEFQKEYDAFKQTPAYRASLTKYTESKE